MADELNNSENVPHKLRYGDADPVIEASLTARPILAADAKFSSKERDLF